MNHSARVNRQSCPFLTKIVEMSNSRKLKYRSVPRAPPRYHHKQQHVEPVPLANRFQELIEQDESPSKLVARPATSPNSSSPSMAQRLHHLLEESGSNNKRVKEDGDGIQHTSNIAGGALRNDEVEMVDSDTSDHEEWTKSSAKVVVPMGQRFNELLQEDSPKPKRKGKRPDRASIKEDEIEGTMTRAQPLPRIAEQFQEALMAAPSFDTSCSPSVQFPVNQDFSTRLQRLLQLEKQQHADISKRLPLSTPLESIQVQVMKKSLEGKLTTCKCQVIQPPSTWTGEEPAASMEVQVIFNSKVAAELELDVGCRVRINPPWREITPLGSTTRIILSTYFCEIMY